MNNNIALFLLEPNSDRFRTTINVMCDAIGTILVSHLSKDDMIIADHEVSETRNCFSKTAILM